MLLGSFGYWVVLITVFTCLLPTISAFHPRHRRNHTGKYSARQKKLHRRSPNHTHQGLKIVVNRTVINVTSSGNVDPRLKSVNTDLDLNSVGGGRGGNKIYQYNKAYQPQPPQIGKVKETHDVNGERKLLDTGTFKSLLNDLVTRLDSYPSPQQERETFLVPGASNLAGYSANHEEGVRHIKSHNNARHCVLHGLWLSTVAGAAIELVPEQQQGHIEIHTKIFELPDNPYPPLINSQWTGKGIISQESPTTLTIVFQEHINTEKENHAKERGGTGDNENDGGVDIQLPRTAVFVGQCLVCQGNPTLQGAWVVFPASQTCSIGSGFSWGNNNGIQTHSQQTGDTFRMATPDAIYLLRYF